VSKSGEYEEIKVTTGSSEITIRNKKEDVPEAHIPEEGQIIDDFDENYDPVDWADFLQYQRSTDHHGGTEVIEKSKFYESEADRPGRFYAIRLSRNRYGEVEIHLLSKFLRRLLQNYVSTQEFEGVTVKPTCINIRSPFVPLYHYLDEMKRAVQKDTEATTRDKASFSALEKLCETKLVANAWETAKDSIEHGRVTYADLWALYKPLDKVVVRASGKDGQLSIMRLNSVRNMRDYDYGNQFTFGQSAWTVTALQTTWDGRAFREELQTRTIPTFLGRKTIAELKIIPLDLHPAKDIIQREAESCGRLWDRLCDGEPRTMMYDGLATPLLVERRSYAMPAVRPEQQNVSFRPMDAGSI
jgi:hypothetical protein